MIVSAEITVHRDGVDVDVTVSGNVTKYAGRYFVDNIESAVPLDRIEHDLAHEAIIDHAIAYHIIRDDAREDLRGY